MAQSLLQIIVAFIFLIVSAYTAYHGYKTLKLGLSILREGKTPEGKYAWHNLTGHQATRVGRRSVIAGLGLSGWSIVFGYVGIKGLAMILNIV